MAKHKKRTWLQHIADAPNGLPSKSHPIHITHITYAYFFYFSLTFREQAYISN